MVKKETKLHGYCRLLDCLHEDYTGKLLKLMTIKDAGKKVYQKSNTFLPGCVVQKKLLQIKLLKMY